MKTAQLTEGSDGGLDNANKAAQQAFEQCLSELNTAAHITPIEDRGAEYTAVYQKAVEALVKWCMAPGESELPYGPTYYDHIFYLLMTRDGNVWGAKGFATKILHDALNLMGKRLSTGNQTPAPQDVEQIATGTANQLSGFADL